MILPAGAPGPDAMPRGGRSHDESGLALGRRKIGKQMDDVKREIADLLKAAESAARSGARAETMADLLYDEALVAVVEGVEGATRGVHEFIPRLSATLESWGPRPEVSLELCDPLVFSGAVAVGFVNATIRPDQPNAEVQRLRAMLAFRRGPRGWRLLLEMYALGVI